jgi:hypothetical protein
MSLLIGLNETGFLSLKNDRDIIINKIKDLEVVLKELDTAYNHLKCFYEPEVRIYKQDSRGRQMYMGSVEIFLPDNVMKREVSFSIDWVDNYKGDFDEKLIEDAKKEAHDTLKTRFKTYFE